MVEKSGGTEMVDLINKSGAKIDAMEGKWNVVDTGFLNNAGASTVINFSLSCLNYVWHPNTILPYYYIQ